MSLAREVRDISASGECNGIRAYDTPFSTEALAMMAHSLLLSYQKASVPILNIDKSIDESNCATCSVPREARQAVRMGVEDIRSDPFNLK
ncbi:hypothetical protein EVAR_25385_1 [Eumeta japonica]|uniref:Uncharacterized protein n=1 Tax=Eumeta variegata TaxID=151549 RepID=A0A4C1V6W6_EUMVA|nr:hypothetical protein EVAR_25385_1 [Eumeta japonica]